VGTPAAIVGIGFAGATTHAASFATSGATATGGTVSAVDAVAITSTQCHAPDAPAIMAAEVPLASKEALVTLAALVVFSAAAALRRCKRP